MAVYIQWTSPAVIYSNHHTHTHMPACTHARTDTVSTVLCPVHTADTDVPRLSSFVALASVVWNGFAMIQNCCQWIISWPSCRLSPTVTDSITPPDVINLTYQWYELSIGSVEILLVMLRSLTQQCTCCTSLQKCKVNIRFSPTLTEEEICQEAMKLVVADLERKAAEELQQQQLRAAAAEQEREAMLQEAQVYFGYF